jgi:hypothetical protein
MLGALLAKIDLQIASLVSPGADAMAGLPKLALGWNQMIDDETLAAALLANRLQRTVFDLDSVTGGLDEAEDLQPIAARAAVSTVLAAVNLIDAHVHEDDPAPADNSIHAGQAACEYSWRTPPSRSRRRTFRSMIRSGSVIGSGTVRSGAAWFRA